MTLSIRMGRADDARECGRICYAAFTAVASAHNFKPDFPTADICTDIVGMMLDHPGYQGIVAQINDKIVGSNFLDETNSIAGIGPVTVDHVIQDRGVGGRLMRAVMEHAASQHAAGVRLVQAGYHSRSLALYSKLGFDGREHLCCVQRPAIRQAAEGYGVRDAGAADVAAFNALCERVHGTRRDGEVRDTVQHGVARVVERGGRVSGYTTGVAFFGHSSGETTNDLAALIGTAESFAGPGFLLPSRNGRLLRWCLIKGLRITQSMTLMTIGLYNEPVGAYLPSVSY